MFLVLLHWTSFSAGCFHFLISRPIKISRKNEKNSVTFITTAKWKLHANGYHKRDDICTCTSTCWVIAPQDAPAMLSSWRKKVKICCRFRPAHSEPDSYNLAVVTLEEIVGWTILHLAFKTTGKSVWKGPLIIKTTMIQVWSVEFMCNRIKFY